MLSEARGAGHAFNVNESYEWVDWNRDGSFSSCSSPVRADVTFAQFHGTASSQVGHDPLETPVSNDLIANSITLARGDYGSSEYVYMIYPTGDTYDTMHYRKAAFPNGGCDQVSAPTVGSCNSWSSEINTGWYGRAATAEAFIDSSGTEYIYLAVRRPNNSLRIFKGSISSTGSLSFSTDKHYSTITIEGTPDIEEYAGQLHVVYKPNDGSNDLMEVVMQSNGTWSSTPTAVGYDSETSATLAKKGDSSLLYLVRTLPGGQLDFLYKSGSSWTGSSSYNVPVDSVYETDQKPAVAWKPYDITASQNSGYFQVVYKDPNSRNWRMLYEGANPNHLVGRFAGPWFERDGLDLLYDARNDNMTAASFEFWQDDSNGDGTLDRDRSTSRFYPYADGAFDTVISDHDDYGRIAGGTCWAFDDVLGTSECTALQLFYLNAIPADPEQEY